MPKLNKGKAKEVDEAQSGFEVIPGGRYRARLVEVSVESGQKAPYWKWVFKISDGKYKGRLQWLNTSLSDNALWKFKEVFKAFGVPANTDTDELLGGEVALLVSTRTIQAGLRAGEEGNQIDRVVALSDIDESDEDETDEDGDDEDEEESASAEDVPPSTAKKGATATAAARTASSDDEEDDPFA
jgi:hypothetical protein